MPATAFTREVVFQDAPLKGPAGRVAVHVPARFDAAQPFLLCVFMHGLEAGGVPPQDHIDKAIGQMGACTGNTLLVAPRFDGNKTGSFGTPGGFSAFIAELATVLPTVLGDGPDIQVVANRAATSAAIVLVAFSGAWRPLAAILDGLRQLGSDDPVARRIAAIQVLDSVYGEVPGSIASVASWMKRDGNATVLVSLFNPSTGLNAKAGNLDLLKRLRPHDAVKDGADWDTLQTPIERGLVAFFSVSTGHLNIPRDGPPARPIAALLNRLADRAAATSPGV